ncbi:MAG: hypothetical protein HY320_02925 [Armatimonadetes bacterium]|nr:hypothetical protein [Armatimonadota bacterium]
MKRAVLLALLTTVLATQARPGRAMPINSDLALTVSEGQWMLRTGYREIDGSGRAPAGRADLHVFAVPAAVVYGLSSRDNILVILPYVTKEVTVRRPGGGQVRRSTRGIGDLNLLWKHRFYAFDALQDVERATWLLGVKLPTGEADVRDRLGRLPRPLQPGSGSVDGIVGAAYSHVHFRRGLHADLAYRLTSEAGGFKFGDTLQYDVTWEYRILPQEFPGAQVNAMLELNGLYSARNRMAGMRLKDSGGHVLFLSPGLQYITPDGSNVIEASVMVPIVRSLNGRQVDPDVNLFISYRRFF